MNAADGGPAFVAFLKKDFLCLIRPDGHIGFPQAPPGQNGLIEYLLICEQPQVRQAFAQAPG